jgi:DNA/RNA endonuclease G (NUC1)
MVEDARASPASGETGRRGAPYPGFAALQRAHLDFRRAFARAGTDGKSARPAAADIREVVARARSTGAIIENESERRAAQGILDYWCTELVSLPGATADDFMPALLAPFDHAGTAPKPVQPTASDQAPDERSREVIRFAAAARLWRDSGKQYGYLLFDDAITRAAQFRDLDPDIAELVKASEIAQTRLTRFKRTAWSVLPAVLLVLLGIVTKLWIDASNSAEIAQKQTELAKLESKEAKEALNKANLALSNARRSAESADALDRRLDVAIAVLRRLYDKKAVSEADLPPEIAASVMQRAGSAAQPPGFVARPAPIDGQGGGYDAEFVDVPIPLPGVTPERVRANYVNFSVVLDKSRRLSAIAASNLDREKRVVLPRAPSEFAPDPDLPRDIQADPQWFKSPEIDFGHLATRQEISWGPAFSGDDPELWRKLNGLVNVLTNVSPQFDTFNRFVWSGLEQWILSEHNKKATRVTIFTGPVFAADDPVIDSGRVPRRFWKIAVSPTATYGAKGLVVDAFMIAQFRAGTNEKIARTEFVPETFRVPVSDIERATGLDFGAAVRQARNSEWADLPMVGAGRKPDVTVYFQFAGMSRGDAVGITNRLKALGWKIPGEERTGAAANQNEVRYGAETDRATADLLVADLKALGLSRMTAKRNPSIKPGFVEIWVSQ